MNQTPRKVSVLLAIAALAVSGSCLAGPSNLWTDNHGHNSIAVPLDTPSQGIARARQLMQDQQHLRAARALHKVVTRWPKASQAHELLAEALTNLGETQLAEKHAQLARATAAGSYAGHGCAFAKLPFAASAIDPPKRRSFSLHEGQHPSRIRSRCHCHRLGRVHSAGGGNRKPACRDFGT